MKSLYDIISEKLVFNKHTKQKQSYISSLSELARNYDFVDVSINDTDRRYIISDKLAKTFIKFMKKQHSQNENNIKNFVVNHNLLDKKYKIFISVSGTRTSPEYYYIVLSDFEIQQVIGQIIYTISENVIRIYISKYAKDYLSPEEFNHLDKVFANIIDYILQSS